MPADLTPLAALLAGLFSSLHCLGMCGGIAGLLGGNAPVRPGGPAGRLWYPLLFNGGRIASYTAAGAIAGGAGFWLGHLLDVPQWTAVLRMVTGLMLAALGLHFAFDWRGLRRIEALGARFWQRLSPLAGRLLPVRTPAAAIGLGLLWGWLPCGLVYTLLLTAAAAGGALHGAGVMLAFGLGTVPALVATATGAATWRRLAANPAWRRLGGALLLGFALWTIAGVLAPHGAAHDHAVPPAGAAPHASVGHGQ